MDTAHWPQEIVIKPMEEKVVQKSTNSSSLERRTRPQKESAINCPRCNSTNTKFCYYNNYSLSQPRYFCKTCRRYWTEGGSLRNVPVGGGSRKNKRSSHNSSMSKKLPDLVVTHAPSQLLSQNPRMHDQEHGQDLNLGFGSTGGFKAISELIQVPNFDHGIKNSTHLSALMNSFMPIPNPPNPDHDSVYSSSGQLMFPMPEFKIPSLNFSLDGTEVSGNSGGAYGTGIQESSSGRLLFPFDDLKTSTITSTTTSTSNTHDGHNNLEQNRDQNGDANGFWTGMLRGGSW